MRPVIMVAVMASGCVVELEEKDRDDAAVDGGALDANVDALAPDAIRLDGPQPDTALPDVARDGPEPAADILLPDGPLPDGPPPDAEPDAPTPDAGLPAAFEGTRYGLLTRLDTPTDAASAQAAGCPVRGRNQGSSLAGLAGLIEGGLRSLVEPDENGERAITLVGRIAADPPLFSAHDATDSALGLVLARDSFDRDGPVNRWIPGLVDDWMSTSGATYTLELPALGLGWGLPLSNTQWWGRYEAEGPGFWLRDGFLTGYLTEGGLITMIAELQANCAGDDAPGQVCGVLNGVLPPGTPPEDGVALILTFLGGEYDVSLRDGVLEPCAGRDCNALSVCLLIEMVPTEIAGVEP